MSIPEQSKTLVEQWWVRLAGGLPSDGTEVRRDLDNLANLVAGFARRVRTDALREAIVAVHAFEELDVPAPFDLSPYSKEDLARAAVLATKRLIGDDLCKLAAAG